LKGIISFRFSVLCWLVSLLAIFIIVGWIDSYQPAKFTGEICPPGIKAAMKKMGPKYNYLMKGETLYVDKGDGKWLKLNYEMR